MNNNITVLIKTKGGHKEGMGDVYSSISIAKELRKRECEILFITNHNESVSSLLEYHEFSYVNATLQSEIEKHVKCKYFDIIILIQLNTDIKEAQVFKKHANMIVTIDDTSETSHLADLCFNVLYPIEKSFSEFEYVALPQNVRRKHNLSKIINQDVQNILIMQGGSDTYGFTKKLMISLFNIPEDIKINVVLGPNFIHNKDIQQTINNSPRDFQIIRGEKDLSDLMIHADLAVSAAGNSMFELACIGVPAIFVCAEPFEVETANRMSEKGFGLNLGFGALINEVQIYNAVKRLIKNKKLRLKYSSNGKKLVDGRGAERMTLKILECQSKNKI